MPGWLSKTWCIFERSITLKTTANLSKCGVPWRTQTPGSTGRFGGFPGVVVIYAVVVSAKHDLPGLPELPQAIESRPG